ncbi:MAG TPA: trypsin-like peptidase domain-containing protein [Phycisphaerae bacterium]|nr:trypsin-like peptidase domain-containing protein [Phycisphaerae bacterium]HNU46691.1 trypsin-like peptidase domain-containing protein [Phycisphaerae bacterium]
MMSYRVVLVVGWILAGAAATGEEPSATDTLARRRTPVVEAYERARDSVVNISATEKVQRYGRDLFGGVFLFPPERSIGSGCVVHEDGYIATNAHVVTAGAQLVAAFADGSEYEARIIGRDVERDLAVIKIDPPRPLVPIKLGRSDDLMIGEQTIAVGNPVGLQNTVTTGVISALHRELQVGGQMVYRDVIQTDASINPGNSGGPLLNVLGELIGINTAVRTDAQNIGFAIPVAQLRDMLPEILEPEKVKKVQVGLKVSVAEPPRVIEVRDGSPAAAAGIRLGDIVRAIDGHSVARGLDFYVYMLQRDAGDKVGLQLVRDEKPVETSVQLVEVPKPDGQRLARELLGLQIQDATGKLAQQLALIGGRGVIVVGVEPGSAAERADLRPGDIIVYLGRYRIRDVDQVGLLLRELRTGEPVDVTFWRIARRQIAEGEVRLYAQ